jgi:hypothetical protein
VNARKPLAAGLGLALALIALLIPTAAQAAFGINGLEATATNKDGSIDLQAGSHPYEYKIHFSFNHNSSGNLEGTLRDLFADLPPGLVANPEAVPRCSGADFEGLTPACPGNTQVGRVEVAAEGFPVLFTAIYNLVPPKGVAASLGTTLFGVNSFQEGSLRTSDYGISAADVTLPTFLKFQSVTETLWGTPPDPGHDAQRECRNSEGVLIEGGCPSEIPPVPFLTLPTSCTGPLQTTVRVDSVEEPDLLRSETSESLNDGGNPAGLTGCQAPPFEPTITAQPETAAAESPTGLHVHLHFGQGQDPEQPASAHLKSAVVTLPQGLALNPSTADGLGACALEGPGGINLPGSEEPAASEPAKCPASSKVGTVEVDTQLLDHPVPGTIYIARQGENPFHSLIALYIAAEDPDRGIVVKLAGKVEPDPVTGQLKATFPNNPQLPFEDVHVDFQGGPRAALTTPSTCGKYTTTTNLTPWTAPQGEDAFPSDSFNVTGGAGGGGCPHNEGEMPNKPSFEAGTVAPLAGSYSPFVLKLRRENGSQQLRALNVTLPPGLTGKLAGVQECSDAQVAVAESRRNPGEGALEKSSPSCPAASEIGVVNVGAGSGSPLFVQGHAYLAGPYKGASLSAAIITPAVAGPFDLGTVVVRAALYVNEATGQITVKSDPVPTILEGIPLDVRSIAVQVNRHEFMLNPTSCEPMAVGAEAISPIFAAAVSQRFQVGGCRGLEFSPKLSLKLSGGTRRNQHPALHAVLTQPSGQANIARLSFTLPATEFIDQNHISNPCTRPQFNEGKCPPSSVLGKVRAFTPLLDKPLEGPIYFRANGGERELPDVVADLHGQVHLVSVGFVDSVHHKGSEESRVRTTIGVVPDAPVSKIVIDLNSGKKRGLFVNSQNLCKTKASQRATVNLTGQNGKTHNFNPLVGNSCK